MGPVVLHRAQWIVPVTSPAIADGVVAVADDRILAVGPSNETGQKFPDALMHDHGCSVLIPALVNTHIHLELSHLPIPTYRKKVNGFTDWIETLLALREERGDLNSDAENAARKLLEQQHRLGVIALGDIGNTELVEGIKDLFPGTILHFNECLGRSAKTRRAILARVAAAPAGKLYTAHAPYSTHGDLIRELKKRAAANNHPFPIHVAEPPSENELLCCGTGDLHLFLKKRGFIDESYDPPAAIDNPGSVRYLHDLGVLDNGTICVHCIHVTPDEVRILAARGANVCLCPGSNRYLRVGRAPVGLFLEHGLRPALGTDSMASNPEISLWREMRILQEENPEIKPFDIFRMATLWGAEALGLEEQYGSLSPGRSARFLAISLRQSISDEPTLYADLVHNNGKRLSWVNEQ